MRVETGGGVGRGGGRGLSRPIRCSNWIRNCSITVDRICIRVYWLVWNT